MEKNLIQDPFSHITKTPHLFLVTLDECFTAVNGHTSRLGAYYPIICDGKPVNVYGFNNQQEAAHFDPTKLRNLLIGSGNTYELWAAETIEDLMRQLQEDPRIKNGTCKLSEHTLYGAIEDLPTCERMHTNEQDDMMLCGKPTDQYNTGCLGGCVIQHYDQEFDPDFIVCPLQRYYSERYLKSRQKAA